MHKSRASKVERCHGGRNRFVCDDALESDNRSPLVSRSNPVAATFAFSAKLRKRVFCRLHPRVRG